MYSRFDKVNSLQWNKQTIKTEYSNEDILCKTPISLYLGIAIARFVNILRLDNNTKHIEQNNFISKYQFDISENTLIMQSVFANESDNLERKN